MSSRSGDTRTKILDAAWRLLEKHRGQGVHMRDIADAAGLSRQSVYVHFGSRAELLVAATRYLDELKGIDARMARVRDAATGVDRLTIWVATWGNYIPEIYGIAKALLLVKDADDAAAAAWKDRMTAVKNECRDAIAALQRDGTLAPPWRTDDATDLLATLLSIRNWEQLRLEYRWSQQRYVETMTRLTQQTFVA